MIVYNEIEPYAAEWLENLIAAGHIAPGRVDRRSITDLRAEDVSAQYQAHFFAGIGVWSHALRLAGWPDDVPVWTGSCPCQPFSAAGRKKGTNDARHLWPEWSRLIRERRPAVVLGEQVASPLGLAWFDSVRADLEGEGYAVAASDLCAAGVGAPHIRQRLYFVAIADGERRQELGVCLRKRQTRQTVSQAPGRGALGHRQLDLFSSALADAGRVQRGEGRLGREIQGRAEPERQAQQPAGRGDACVLGDSGGPRGGRDTRAIPGAQGTRGSSRGVTGDLAHEPIATGAARPVGGFWADADWIPCSDGKSRPVEPGTFPLVDRASGRVGRLRAYGNAIVGPLAAVFVQSVMDLLTVTPVR